MSYITKQIDEMVISILLNSGIGLIPTDTVYGLSGRALDSLALEKLHKLKDRGNQKPFIILISDFKMLDSLSVNKEEVRFAEKYWPGPLTIVCDAPNSPIWLNLGLNTLAVRMPKNDNLRDLIDQIGPVISTSANLPGQRVVKTAQEAQNIFGERLDFYIDTGEINNTFPSTIVKSSKSGLQILRQGAFKIKEEL